MDELSELDLKISELEDKAGEIEDRLYDRQHRVDDLADAIARLDDKDSPAERQRLQGLRNTHQAEAIQLTSQLKFVNDQLDEIGRQFREKKVLQPDWRPQRPDKDEPVPPKPPKPKR